MPTARAAPAAGIAPPHNLEAEQSVLGAILLSDRSLYALVIEEGLRPEDFYRERHGVDLRGDARALQRERAGRRADGDRPPAPDRPARGGRRPGGVDELTGRRPGGRARAPLRADRRENALLRRLLRPPTRSRRACSAHEARAARARRAGREGDARGRARRPPAGLPRDRGGAARGARQAPPPVDRGHVADGHAVRASRTSTRSPAAFSRAT